ncbi:MAG: hypothetical protein JOZ92_02320 [Candidatus Dormibacteraeota bacterium]|nr:hypothetical protein [Candidatus Dormibacteraeota bacterium]
MGRVHEVVWEGDGDPARGLSSAYHELLVEKAKTRAGRLASVRAIAVAGERLLGELVPEC